MNIVTFSSNAYENDEQTTTTRFTTFSLTRGTNSEGQFLESFQNKIDSGRPAGFSFRGRAILEKASNLEAIECRGLTGPRSNIANEREAITQEGELVTIAYSFWDNTQISKTGIITELTIRAGPRGKLSWRADFVFHEIDHLRFHFSSLVLHAVAQ